MKKSAELLFILLWLNGEREEKKKTGSFTHKVQEILS
jgi:hypothetical protein